MLRRTVMTVLLASCGPASGPFAPVTVELDLTAAPASEQYAVMALANKGSGSTFPDGGGQGGWNPLTQATWDAGVLHGSPQQVLVGAEVEVIVIVPTPAHPDGDTDATCHGTRSVPAGGLSLNARPVRNATGDSCVFTWTP